MLSNASLNDYEQIFLAYRRQAPVSSVDGHPELDPLVRNLRLASAQELKAAVKQSSAVMEADRTDAQVLSIAGIQTGIVEGLTADMAVSMDWSSDDRAVLALVFHTGTIN